MERRWNGALVGALAVLALAAEGRAQGDSLEAARASFERGMAALRARDYEAALRELEGSYRLRASPVVLVNMGRAYLETGRLLDARYAFSRALADGEGRWSAEQLAELQRDLARVQARLGRVLIYHGSPAMRVRVDGGDAVAAPGGEVWLLPGRRELVVESEGRSFRWRMLISAGRREQWDLANSVAVVSADASATAAPSRSGSPGRSLLAAGGVLLTAGYALEVVNASIGLAGNYCNAGCPNVRWTYGLGLVPVLGPVLGHFYWDGSLALSLSLGMAIPSAIVQGVGFGLLIAGARVNAVAAAPRARWGLAPILAREMAGLQVLGTF